MYKLVQDGIIRLSDNAFIPKDPANRHYREYLRWLAEGNEPEPEFTLEEIKERLKREIKTIRKQKEIDGIVIITKSVERLYIGTSENDKINILSVINAYDKGIISQDVTQDWDFKNGIVKTLNYQQLVEIGSFMLDYVKKLFSAQRQHFVAIDSISTEEGLRNYNKDQFWHSNEYESQTIP